MRHGEHSTYDYDGVGNLSKLALRTT